LRLGEEYLPHFRETDFLMHWVEKPGTSLEAMRRITEIASKELRHGVKVKNNQGQEVNPVLNFGSHIGRAEVADEVVGPNFTELWISIDNNVPYEETVGKIQEVVDGYPGLKRDLLTYLKEAIKEVVSPGSGGSIVVRIYGPELAGLRNKAQDVKKVMEGVEGVTTLQVDSQVLVPQLQVKLRPAAAARFGLTGGQIRRAVDTLVKGTKVGEVYYNQMSFDTVVWGVPTVRNDISAICKLPIDLPQGGYVPLGDVADIEITPAPNEIKREKASRYINVTCNVKGRDLGSVARDIQKAVSDPEKVTFDAGYFPEFLGEYAARAESQRRLFVLAGLSLIGIFLLLQLDFRSWKLASLVLFTIPFALVGGVVGTIMQGGVLSLGSLVGFVTVLGIAARNGIMLVSHYRHLEESEGQEFGPELVIRGSEERLAPILMTALATGLALVPLIIGGNQPGHEIEYPMAVVILGGLITSTILNLFLLPPLYAAYGRLTPRAE
jgi:Cu/Ag efflux pump CusA